MKVTNKKTTSQTRSTKIKTETTKRTARIFSRHPSHSQLRKTVLVPVLTVVRLGSHTKGNLPYKVEINKAENIDNSANKLLMKKCFKEHGVKTANWTSNPKEAEALGFPLVSKSHWGSKGKGNTLIKDKAALKRFLDSHSNNLGNYIFEKYYNYNREYRLHVTAEGCFYACRKMIKEETPEDQRWFRNDSNSVWITEFNIIKQGNKITGLSNVVNPQFDKPSNWNEIAAECVKALKAVGLDVGACDVRVQSAADAKGNKRGKPEFIIIEINSAPGLGDLGLIKYKEIIPKIVNYKLNN